MTVPALRLSAPDLELSMELVPWDTESFGVRVAQVESIAVHQPRQAMDRAAAMQAWLESNEVMLASARLKEHRLAESFLLEAAGFRFVEMVYSMHLDLSPQPSDEAPLCWEHATAQDLPELQSIAATAFATGRWNVDWRVGPALAGRRYADWVLRSLDSATQQVLLVRHEGRVAGFFIVEELDDDAAYWHLTAVSPHLHGRGWGRRMWRSMALRHAAMGARTVRTTISARNIPVLNLYARLGWRFEECQMTFHWASANWQAPSAPEVP